jgi:hypothetical protein
MSKRNKNKWHAAHASSPVREALIPQTSAPASPDPVLEYGPISPAQLAANRANALLSTGPRTAAGLAKSSQNAVKSALTGRTVLLPSDDVEEYAAFLAGFQRDLKPVGQAECEFVQIIVDCFWRLRRIQALEFALYAHGHEQFETAFQDCPAQDRYMKTLLQTHLTYEKQFRNYQIQEARLDRKRVQAMAELERLQADRKANDEPASSTASAKEQLASDEEFFAALDAGFIPPRIAAQIAATKPIDQNGFDFSNPVSTAAQDASAAPEHPLMDEKAA